MVDYTGDLRGGIEGDSRNVDYSSYNAITRLSISYSVAGLISKYVHII